MIPFAWLIDWLNDWLIEQTISRLIDWLIERLINPFILRLIDWLIDWLTDCLQSYLLHHRSKPLHCFRWRIPRIPFLDKQYLKSALFQDTIKWVLRECDIKHIHGLPGHPCNADIFNQRANKLKKHRLTCQIRILCGHFIDHHGRVVNVDDIAVAHGVEIGAHVAVSASWRKNSYKIRFIRRSFLSWFRGPRTKIRASLAMCGSNKAAKFSVLQHHSKLSSSWNERNHYYLVGKKSMTNQSINQSVDQSKNLSIRPSTNRLVNQAINLPQKPPNESYEHRIVAISP